MAAKDDGANGLRGPIFNKLNTTGRVLDLPIPVKDGRMDLGEVTIRLNPDDSVLVHVPLLVQLLDKALSDKARQTLLALGGPFVAIERIVEAGFQVKFDTALQELGISLTADQRPVGDIYIGSRKPAASTHLAEPAQVSAYLNIIGGLDWVWGHRESDSFLYSAGDSVIGRLDLESAIRISGAVFENRAVYKSSYEAFLCRDVASCNLAFEPGFQRLSSRVVYDMPSHALRWIAGDNDALGIGPQGTPEFLGLSVEKAPAKFGNAASLRPSPKSTFRIDRPSDVEVQINGVTLHRMHLQPGTYNVRDLPVATGANEIKLRITDASGETRTQKLTAYYDTRLLRAGASEWALLAGVPSALLADERIYSEQGWFGSGFIRFGLTDRLTLEGHAQADADVAMTGAGVIAHTPWGVAALRGAISHHDGDWGTSFGFDWSVVNFRGPFGKPGHSFRISAEARSSDFSVPGSVVDGSFHTIARPTGYRTRVDGFYTLPVADGISATLAGRWLQQPRYGNLVIGLPLGSDSYGVDLTVSNSLTHTTTLALTVGYAKEPRWADIIRGRESEGDFRVIGRLNFRFDERTNFAASYDTAHQTTQLSANRHGDSTLGRWHVSVTAQHDQQAESASVAGSANLVGNRGEVTVSHGASSIDGLFFGLDGRPSYQRSSLRVGTSIAFADGKFAIGAPVRNGAFAIVHPHESIADKEVIVGDPQHPRGRADALGPALINNLPAYHQSSFPVDAEDLPVGYSLGAAAFEINAPYKAGYRLEVGSAFSVYAHGTLLKATGEPVALSSGVARPSSGDGRQVSVFTNASGKFGAEGLAPGEWRIEVDDGGHLTVYDINIPAGVQGLFDAGTLRPRSSS